MLTARGIKILAQRSGETMELTYVVVLVAHYHSPCLQFKYVCPYHTLLLSLSTVRLNLLCRTLQLFLSTVRICLSLSHTVAFLVYRVFMSALVALCSFPCLPRVYLCPCPTLSLSLFIAAICLSLSYTSALLV